MRKLASIQKISKLEPIEGADKLEKATVLGWEVVVQKGEFQEGDFCVYCEIDSILPEREEFEFLRQIKFRIKTIKLRGQISQGICFQLSVLPEKIKIKEDVDVTKMLGVTKHDPYKQIKLNQVNKVVFPSWIPSFVARRLNRIKFIKRFFSKIYSNKSFPSAIPKTDETRVQVLQGLLNKYEGTEAYITEKLDGSSITVYQINGKFGVCSRNIDLRKDKNNNFWKVAIEHDLENKLKLIFGDQDVALQGELVGPGIQGNKYKLEELEVFFFNLFFVKEQRYADLDYFLEHMFMLNEKNCPILYPEYKISNSIPELLELAKGKSILNEKVEREGIVIRPIREIEDKEFSKRLVKNRVSFKVINNDFLLEYGE